MEKFFTIGEAAKLANVTAETLRHYDRIGLISPCKVDQWTGYRYYSEQELARLKIIRALKSLDLPLEEIGRMLASADLGETVRFLREAERSADEKIAELQEMKERIGRARRFYEEKSAEVRREGFYTQHLAQRVILLADRPITPTVADLLNYQRHFFAQVGEQREKFAFEDVAGIYRAGEEERMFAVCTKYVPRQDLRILPAGTYLCADCTQQESETAMRALLTEAMGRGCPPPPFTVSIIVLAGVAQWGYRLEVPLRPQKDEQ